MHSLRIIHETTYHYKTPVTFGEHTAMLRPREGHDLHIDDARLEIEPRASTRWLRDIYGNCISELMSHIGKNTPKANTRTKTPKNTIKIGSICAPNVLTSYSTSA